MNDLWDNFGNDFTYPGNLPSYIEEYSEDGDNHVTTPDQMPSHLVKCLPMPGMLLLYSLVHFVKILQYKFWVFIRSFFTM